MIEKILAHGAWRAAAVCALLVAAIAWWQSSTRTVSATSSGGTSADGMICAVGTFSANIEHLYVFDTNSRHLLVYESRLRPDQTDQVVMLTSARVVDKDIEVVKRGLDLRFYDKPGYSVDDIAKELDKPTKKTR